MLNAIHYSEKSICKEKKLEQAQWYNDKIEHSSGRILEWSTA
jgi:hypothetical protein